MKCPTCGRLFGANIYQCGTGHSACETCKKNNKLCGQCMQPLTDIKNYSLQEYIAGLNLKAPCPNSEHGCKLSFSQDKIDAHLKVCHAGMACPMAAHDKKCTWKGSLTQLSRHFAADHPDTLKATVDQELVLKPNLLEQLDIDSYKNINFIDMGNNKFLSYLTLDKDTVSMAVQMLADEKYASRWSFELHLYNKAEPNRKITFRDSCKSIDVPLKSLDEDATCVIPLSLARTFFNERIDGMNYKFFIKQLPGPPKKPKQIKPKKKSNSGSGSDDVDEVARIAKLLQQHQLEELGPFI